MSWCGALLVLISVPFLWWWLVLFIVALVLFQNLSGKGFHNGGI